jgi:hypothetical protein
VAANPANPDEWLALFTTDTGRTVQADGSGNLVGSDGSTGVLWRWDGSTWTNIPIATPSLGSNTRIGFGALDWRVSGWAFLAARSYGSWAYQGVGTTQGTTASNSANAGVGLAILADGRVVIGSSGNSSGAGDNDNVYYSSGSSLLLAGSATGEDRDLTVAAYPTGNRIVCPSDDNDQGTRGRIYAAEDYAAAQPTLRISSSVGLTAQITADERVYIGNRTGIAEITDLFGTPSVSVVAGSGSGVGRIGMDKQTRTLVAALSGSAGTVYLWDGREETAIDSSSISSELINYVEVLA